MKSPKKPGAVRVEVTARDIERGTCNSGYHCPIARALNRAGKWRKVAVVGCQWAFLGDHKCAITARAREWISQFDRGAPVKPFTFTLRGWR